MKFILYSSFILLSLSISISERTQAQSPHWNWANQIGGEAYDDIGYAIACDPTGNVYTSGSFRGTVDFDPGAGTFNLTGDAEGDIFISKLDVSGNFLWAVAIAGAVEEYYENGTSIVIDPAGYVYTTGNFYGTVDFDPGPGTFNLTSVGLSMFISKLDSAGNFVWAKAMGDPVVPFSIAFDPAGAGGVYTTGWFAGTVDFDPGAGVYNLTANWDWDIFISKIDGSGNFVWAKSFGGTEGEGVYSLAVDPAGTGGVYTTGYFSGTVDFDPGAGIFNLFGFGMFISKLDGAGNFVWAKSCTAGSNSQIAVDATGNGDVYTTALFNGTVDLDPGPGVFYLTSSGNADIFILKLNSSGNFVWAKAIGEGNDNIITGYAIAVDPNGSGEVYTTGVFYGLVDFDPGPGYFPLNANLYDIFISKLDTLGNFVWAKGVGGTNIDYGYAIALSTSGNVHVTGKFLSPSIDFDSTTIINSNPGQWLQDPESGAYFFVSNDVFIAKLDACSGLVTSTANSGPGSLRDVISCVSNGGTITFALAPMSQITLTTGEIEIHKNLTISGSGMFNLTLSGNNESRIFHLLWGNNLAIENLTLKNGTAITNGGAISAEGNLTLENVLLENNFENGLPKGMTVVPGYMVTIAGNVDIKN